MGNTISGFGAQFFPDQEVHATDLNAVQYSALHNLQVYLKGVTKTPGVLLDSYTTNEALRVTANGDGTRISVAQGTAIDPQGRVIDVPYAPTVSSGSLNADPLYQPARDARLDLDPNVSAAGTYYVNLTHTPIYSMVEVNDSGDTSATRVYDGYTISVDSTRTNEGVVLASTTFDASGSIEQTTDLDGYLNPNSGLRFALFDDRVGYETYDHGKGSLEESVVTLNAAVFDEELEKTVGFLFPADGHSLVTKLHRNSTITRMEMAYEGTGTVIWNLWSGSTYSGKQTTQVGSLSTAVPNVYTTTNLNTVYYSGHPLYFQLIQADDTVTRVTCTVVYKRR